MLILAAMLVPWLWLHLDYAPNLATNYIIEHTPPDNAVSLQTALGSLSFPSAILGGMMFVASFGVFAGIAYALLKERSRLVAIIAAALIEPGLVLFAFPNVTLLALAPLLLTGVVLDRLARRDPPILNRSRGGIGSDISRRQVLTRLALFSLGGLAVSAIDGLPTFLSDLSSLAVQRKLFDFIPPAARVAGFEIPKLASEISPVNKFYMMRKFATPIPTIPADWKLSIGGLVEKPLTFTLDELLNKPRQDVYLTRQCISNNVGGILISTALMSGVLLKDIMGEAGIKSGAIDIVFYGRDGYSESLPVVYALEHGLLAYAMNGLSLPSAHGAPLRVEMIGMYGFKSMKWLDRIEIVDQHYVAIWESEGYTAVPDVKTMSRIDTIAPTPNGAVIAGIAYAGLRGISRIEVQINDGNWQPAILNTPPLAQQTWVQWRYETTQRGTITATVRAVDGDGNPQITVPLPPAPSGASGLHSKTASV